jgi:hypothetical protein
VVVGGELESRQRRRERERERALLLLLIFTAAVVLECRGNKQARLCLLLRVCVCHEYPFSCVLLPPSFFCSSLVRMSTASA